MTRKSSCILKFSNSGKKEQLEKLYNVFLSDVRSYLNLIQRKELPLKKFLSSKELPELSMPHSKWKALCYKQASEIFRSCLEVKKGQLEKRFIKIQKYFYRKSIYPKLRKINFSKLSVNIWKRIKPEVTKISIEIEEHLLDILSTPDSHFDEFIRLKLPFFHEKKKRALTINLPIKRHKHLNRFLTEGWTRRKTILLRKNQKEEFILDFIFEKEEVKKREEGDEVGIDLGYKKLITSSQGKFYGSELEQIYIKLSKKKRGSRNYQQLLRHRINLTNKVIKEFISDNPILFTLCVEDLKDLRSKSKMSRSSLNKQQYFIYRQVLDKLERVSEEEGFHLEKVNPAYTSQTCSGCGEVNKLNRVGEVYRCRSCGIQMDADHNAAINILLRGVYSPSATER